MAMQSLLRILVIVSLVGCVQSGGPGTDTSVETLDAGAQQAADDAGSCTPISCAEVGESCGVFSNQCGGVLEGCNECNAPESCGGGGVANTCGSGECTKEGDMELCLDAETNCGAITRTDGCGEIRTVISCGVCQGSMTCGGAGSPGVCGEPPFQFWQGWKLSSDYPDYILKVAPISSGFLTAWISRLEPYSIFKVSRRDADGELLWSTNVEAPQETTQQKLRPRAMLAEANGSSYFLVQSPGELQVGGVSGESGLQLVYLSANGTVQWMQALPGYAKNGFLALRPGGGVCYAIHGKREAYLHSISLGCVDAAGDEQWSQYYNRATPLFLGLDEAGNSYVTGEYQSQSPLSDGEAGNFVMSFNATGTQRWLHRDLVRGVMKSDGTFLFVRRNTDDDTIKIARVTSAGELQWLENTLEAEVATNLQLAWSGDGYYLKFTYRGDFKINGQTLSSESYLDDDGMIVRFAADGEALWARQSTEVLGHFCVREQTGDVWLSTRALADSRTFVTGFGPDGSLKLREEALSGGNAGMSGLECSDDYLYFKAKVDFGGSVGPNGPVLQPSDLQGGIVGRRLWPE